MKYAGGGLGVHEVYYDKKGLGWTADPIITGDNIKELLDTLETIKKDIIKSSKDILKYEYKNSS